MILSFLDFLNHNAPAIQAIAAVVTTGATIVLVIVTRRYVQLTEGLAKTARSQLMHAQEMTLARRRQLKSLVGTLRGHVQRLPIAKEHAAKITQASVWDDADISMLLELAGEAGEDAAAVAGRAATAFRWLKARITDVQQQAANRTVGVDWPRFPHDRWSEEMARVNDAVRELWKAANAALGESTEEDH